MPPKSKEVVKKPAPPVLRPEISEASLNYVPDDAVDGYENRIETGIDWTLIEQAGRYHKERCLRTNIPKSTFSQALQKKIEKSILNGFLENNSNLSLAEQWEISLPITLWDNEKFADKEGQKCFRSINSITDNLISLIKRSVHLNDRDELKKDLLLVPVLRINDAEMTDLDEYLKEFKKLTKLSFCGNFIQEIDTTFLPAALRFLELQANRIINIDNFVEHLPVDLLYLGLSRNLLGTPESVGGLSRLPQNLSALDLSDNDISDLEFVLNALAVLPSLKSLLLAGNPCSVCACYAKTIVMRLPNLQWLDCREILPTDRTAEPFDPHPDDLRSSYFNFTVFRIMSVLQPPKPEKGATTAFHVELELPLLDSERRRFLMYRGNESLTEMLPPPEDDNWPLTKTLSDLESKVVDIDSSSHESDIYNHLSLRDPREIRHYTTFESNKVQWNKVMNFQEPTVRIFCPNLMALRDTFRTVITVRLVYTVTPSGKPGKMDKKSVSSFKPSGEFRVVLATMKCALRRPDWSQHSQHFHWDDSLGTDEAIHWGEGDLSVLQYSQAAPKTPKTKQENDPSSSRQMPPENLTCHFGFGIDTLRH